MRLRYLIQYYKDEEKSCIKDCVLLEPTDAYMRASSMV